MSGQALVQPATFTFSRANREAAEGIVARYPAGRQASAVMPLLDLAQRQNDGWLPTAALDHVAEVLDMPPIQVYEVATFYTMYNLDPIGRHHVQVCTNISCLLRGSDHVAQACRNALGVDFGETTEDGLFTLSEVECLGACANAPMMQIDDDFYEDLDAASAQSVLNGLRRGDRPTPGPQSGRRGAEPAGGLTTLKDVAGDGKGGDA
jgi:NADH-quinone oxidoreductase E subunit